MGVFAWDSTLQRHTKSARVRENKLAEFANVKGKISLPRLIPTNGVATVSSNSMADGYSILAVASWPPELLAMGSLRVK
jgi:hypothetical protein